VALAAQGFGVPRPTGALTMRHVQRVVDTVGVLQVDSVNVLVRSHYVPLFSRLGAYPRELLDRACGTAPRRLVECVAHEASFVPPATHRLLRFRMARAHQDAWPGLVRTARDGAAVVEAVIAEVAARGPLTALQIEQAIGQEGPRDRSSWGWNWSQTRRATEFAFWSGRISSAGRTPQFERRYDLPERVLPAHVARAADPDPAQACRELIEIAARAHGVGTELCLRDYFRLGSRAARAAIAELVEDGVLLPVEVRGWPRPAYLHREARLPRRVTARALLTPFDSLVWQRRRAEELFGFRYRIEIYTPAAQRVHGYYVLPFLLGDRLAARVDLKADRLAPGGGALAVRAAWAEPDVAPDCDGHGHLAAELAAELALMARWLGLSAVDVEPRGDLAPALAPAVEALG
jgi:uncharacterized protein YcaQ